jgi:hypothetical protein
VALSVAMALALVGVWPAAVGAEDAADPMAPAYFTFTLESVEESPMGGEHMDEMEVRGHEEMDVIEASDPRASGLLTTIANWNWVVHEDTGFMTAATSVRLANESGAWSGTGRAGLAGVEGRSLLSLMAALTGEGDYEGLSLVMNQYRYADAETFWGVILPSDEVPPMPEPVEPTSELTNLTRGK